MSQVTVGTQTTIANLYISILGRNPEPAGFGFWCDRLADNGNTTAAAADIARGFAGSPEFIATYGGQTTTGAMTLMYNNVLNRAPDANGLAFWTTQANALIARGQSVGDAYALTGAAIITTAGTNSSSDTALIVAKQTAAIASGTGSGGSGATFTLTTNIETVNANNGDVSGVINGAAGSTYQTGDTINNAKNLNITVSGVAGGDAGVTATLNNVANMNVRSVVAGTQVLNAALFTGVTNLTTSAVILGANTTVANGALATTYGAANTTVANTLSIGIRAADLTGTANVLNLLAINAGNSFATVGALDTNNRITINMTSNGVESVALATTGANNLILVGNPAVGTATDYATLTVTGSGNNAINVARMGQTLTYNTATATGNNALNFNAGLQSNTTITGGSGADTILVQQTGVVAGITVTGIEVLRSVTGIGAETNAGNTGTIAFNAGSSLTTMRIDGTGGAGLSQAGQLSLINPGTITRINYVGNGLNANINDAQEFISTVITGTYSGTADTVTMNFNNKDVTQLAGYTINGANAGVPGLTANGVEAFVINSSNNTAATAVTTLNGLVSSTLQTVTTTSTGGVALGVINAAPTGGGNSALTSVNLAGVTGTANSSLSFAGVQSVGAATQIVAPAGTGNFSITTGVQQVGDTLLITGGNARTTTIAANDGAGAGFVGTLVYSSSAAGVFNILFPGGVGAADSTTIVTLAGAGSNNLIQGFVGNDLITLAASGLGSNNTILAGDGANVINASASTVRISINAGIGNDSITGGSAGDVINSGAGADVITANGGADSITLGAGSQRVIQGALDSTVSTSNTLGANITTGNTLAFVGGVDTVTNFTGGAGGDVFVAANRTLPIIGNGVASNALVAGQNYYLSGNFVVGTGLFTITGDGLGADTMIIQGYAGAGTDLSTNASIVILVGTNSNTLDANNIG